MDRYISAIGEERTYDQWKEWAVEFYRICEIKDLPHDWFERVTKILKLSKCITMGML